MFRVITFNVRLNTSYDGPNAFPYRKERVLAFFDEMKPDLIGFQELTGPMMLELSERMPEYAFIGCGREKDLSGERNDIAYRKDRFLFEESGTFWLSSTPDAPGSRFEKQSWCPRICTFGLFHLLDENFRFWYYNTHLDHEFDEARQLGLSLVLEHAADTRKKDNLPQMLTGDFNFTPGESAYALLNTWADKTPRIQPTYHGYGQADPPVKIDYVFTKGAPNGEWLAHSVRFGADGGYLSDHDAIVVDYLG